MKREQFKELIVLNGFEPIKALVNADSIARIEERDNGTARIYFIANSKTPVTTEASYQSLREWLLGEI